jgi:hypothetical protein
VKRSYTCAIAIVFFAAAASAAMPDTDYLRRLSGHYPWQGAEQGDLSFFEVPTVAKSLKRMLPPDTVVELTRELTTGSPNRIVDGYLLVSACKPHDCPSKNYIAVTNLRNAAVVVVLYDASLGRDVRTSTRCFSESGSLRLLPDSVIEEVLEGFLTRMSKDQQLYATNQWVDALTCSDGSNTSLERTRAR